MKPQRLATRVIMAAAVATSLIGCSKSDQLPTYRTTGKVVFRDGRPLEGGTIVFESIDHPVTARGVIELDGTFRLGTYDEGDGAVAGPHRAAVSPPMDMAIDRDEVRTPRVVHPRYTDIEASGLEFEVSAEGPNELQVQVSQR